MHRCNIKNISRLIIPGKAIETLLNLLWKQEKEAGVIVERELSIYFFRMVYGIESLLSKVNDATTEYLSQHGLLIVFVCSNVPGYETL